MKIIWPLTVVKTRYGGVYEGGNWAAFNMYPYDIPEDAFDEDLVCLDWWLENGDAIGKGATPEEAIDSLRRIIDEAL